MELLKMKKLLEFQKDFSAKKIDFFFGKKIESLN